MPTVTIKKADGTSAGSAVLSDKLFGVTPNAGLLHQAVLAERTNSRQDTRQAKGRSDVAGGGRKPYRQKGTGRARQGSISAPHYRHGGMALAFSPRDLSVRLPKKARRVAITSALSAKAADEEIIVVDSLGFDSISTKSAAGLLKTLGITGRALVVLPEHDLTVYRSFRNIPGVEVRVAPAFSVQDVLNTERVIIVQAALVKLEAVWGGNVPAAQEVAAE